MAILTFKVGHVYCYDCVKAVGKFVGKIQGVQSVSVKNNDSAVIEYNPASLEFDEEKFKQIVAETIERLGFRIKEY
jgi:copper chaperone CopZ